MPRNIKAIELWKNNPQDRGGPPLVLITFEFPCTWTILNIDDLKEILRQWIIGEEIRYPPEKGYRGRWLLLEELHKVFYEERP